MKGWQRRGNAWAVERDGGGARDLLRLLCAALVGQFRQPGGRGEGRYPEATAVRAWYQEERTPGASWRQAALRGGPLCTQDVRFAGCSASLAPNDGEQRGKYLASTRRMGALRGSIGRVSFLSSPLTGSGCKARCDSPGWPRAAPQSQARRWRAIPCCPSFPSRLHRQAGGNRGRVGLAG